MATPSQHSNATNSNITFAEQITLEEYNKQKKDYTEKALLELNAHMREFKQTKRNKSQDNICDDSEDNSDEDSKSNDFSKVNVIIKNYKNSTNIGNTGNTNTSLEQKHIVSKAISSNSIELQNSIYAIRELDLQAQQKLKNQITKLKIALDEEERKNHFLKLDLCNAQVDISNLRTALHDQDSKIKQLETADTKSWWKIIKLKLFIGFLLLLYFNFLLDIVILQR